MTDCSLTCTTNTHSNISTPEIKRSPIPLQKVKSSLLFQNSTQEAFSISEKEPVKSVEIYFPSELLKTQLDVSASTTVEELLRSALLRFSEDKAIDLNPSHYEVYVAKKNGKAKDDYPSYLGSQIVAKTGNHTFALVHVADSEEPLKKASMDLISPTRNKHRKNTDSSHHPKQQDPLYNNCLTDANDVNARRKTRSKEIEPQVLPKKTSWFSSFLCCTH